MQPSVLCPSSTELEEVGVIRRAAPSIWSFDTRERADRVRAAMANSGFAIPIGDHVAVMPADAGRLGLDLPLALCVLLADRSHEHLQRDGWIAWGGLNLDGRTRTVDEELLNDLGPQPFVGRVWDPVHHIPAPHEDAFLSIVTVDSLEHAWDTLVSFAFLETEIWAPAGLTASSFARD